MTNDNLSQYDGLFVGDNRNRFEVGDIGFLLELAPGRGAKRYELRQFPARTADTFSDILFGTVDGGHTTVKALGMAKIAEVARNGRGKIVTLHGPDLDDALHELGFPELIP